MNQKKLDGLIYEWVQDVITETSGYPSETQESKIMKNGVRVQGGITYTPVYKSKPIIRALNNYINELNLRQKNCITGKYLNSMNIKEIADYCGCSMSSINRDIRKARRVLLEKLTLFSHNKRSI